MYDLHSHILPSMDDGAQDAEEALGMLNIAAASGTKTIVATPHVIEGVWLPAWDDIVEHTRVLALASMHLGLGIKIYPGAEVAMGMDILEYLPGPGPYCLNGSRYLLTELPAAEVPSYADEYFFTLQARGIVPVIAHPERNPVLATRPEILRNWQAKGILLQLNAPSLTGRMGKAVMQQAEKLLRENMISVIGSDAHGTNTRRPNIREAKEKIIAMAGPTVLKKFNENAASIIRNEEVEIAEYIEPAVHKTSILQWLTNF